MLVNLYRFFICCCHFWLSCPYNFHTDSCCSIRNLTFNWAAEGMYISKYMFLLQSIFASTLFYCCSLTPFPLCHYPRSNQELIDSIYGSNLLFFAQRVFHVISAPCCAFFYSNFTASCTINQATSSLRSSSPCLHNSHNNIFSCTVRKFWQLLLGCTKDLWLALLKGCLPLSLIAGLCCTARLLWTSSGEALQIAVRTEMDLWWALNFTLLRFALLILLGRTNGQFSGLHHFRTGYCRRGRNR